ncbi:Prolamin-like domain [Arabidopsis thaliana x Arabidopsis arenosa]|uniref:Prolamin-like domain n=1 Tax=Arabidopsis thaliana x Arabidopsis arenosa TaxID=1240361 RepID=A0A8T1YW49_9BRAS|nr:Prolamin-like domain [Arabidopsis thaliana x Arabidopsis arenosa]
MGTKQIFTVMFFILSVIMALLCHHQSEAQAPIPNPGDCFSSIKNVKGCVDALKAATKGHLKGLGKDCCHAINGLADDCFPILFPGKHYIAVLVKDACVFN